MRKNAFILSILMLLSAVAAKADMWSLPEKTDYFSEDSAYVLTVIPTETPKKYYEYIFAKPKKRKKFNAADTTVIQCHAILYKVNGKKREPVWKKQLINAQAPVYVIVSNDGQRVITFDDWNSVGYGLDVMVVYDETGGLKKRYKLEEISPFPINDYFIGMSSIWWREDVVFLDNKNIEITYRDMERRTKKRVYNLDRLTFED